MSEQITTPDTAIFLFISFIILVILCSTSIVLWFSFFRKKDMRIKTLNIFSYLEAYLPSSAVSSEFSQLQKKYNRLYRETLAGLYKIDLNGHYIDATATYAALLGYQDKDKMPLGKKDSPRTLYGDPSEFDHLIEEVVSKKFVSGFEVLLDTQNDGMKWFSQTLKLHEDEGQPYIEGKMLDISRLRMAQSELVRAKEEAELAGRSKTEFLANISHELRTPLNAIIGFSEVIKNELLGPIEQEDYKEYADDIYHSGKLLLKLINDILDVAKIESGKRELNEKILNINQVVDDTIRLLRMKASQKHIQLQNIIPTDIPDIRADELALKQIISNLLSNAVKFTKDGGEVLVNASLNRRGEFELTVQDQGVGIAKADITKALSPFGQVGVDITKKNEGTGLGLPIVAALAELHGGKFEIESDVGQGVLARIIFPKARIMQMAEV